MKWDELIQIVGSEPVFSSTLLMAENSTRSEIQLQLTRWVKAGKLCQMRRGIYSLAEPHRKVSAHPFLIANQIKRASYVSLQSALTYYGLIPEYTPVTTSITTGRPDKYNTPAGVFSYQHIKKSLFLDYSYIKVTEQQSAFVATPEKSLLDLIYLTPYSDKLEYLRELRLQNTERLNMNNLLSLAKKSNSQKLIRAARRITKLVNEETEAYVNL